MTGPPTKFEQQVAAALWDLMVRDQHVTLRGWADLLAPRVAAAIHTAAVEAWKRCHETLGTDEAEALAVSALRGETP